MLTLLGDQQAPIQAAPKSGSTVTSIRDGDVFWRDLLNDLQLVDNGGTQAPLLVGARTDKAHANSAASSAAAHKKTDETGFASRVLVDWEHETNVTKRY